MTQPIQTNINNLPSDVIAHICSFLGTSADIQNVVYTNRLFSYAGIRSTIFQQHLKLKNMIKHFQGNLYSLGCKSQADQLGGLNSDIAKISAFNNLSMLKDSLRKIKEACVNILKTVPQKDSSTGKLSKESMVKVNSLARGTRDITPFGFTDTIVLAILYARFDAKSINQMALFNELMKMGEMNRAIEIIDTISDVNDRSRVYLEVSKEWVKRGKIEKAIEIADAFCIGGGKAEAFCRIFELLIARNEEKKAINLFDRIQWGSLDKGGYKDKGVCLIAAALIDLNQWERAQELFKLISDTDTLGLIYGARAIFLTAHGGIIKEIKTIINKIRDTSIKERAICGVCEKFIQHNLHDKAIEIAKMYPSLGSCSEALTLISIDLTGRGKINKAIEVANMIKDDGSTSRCNQARAIRIISKAFIAKDDIQNAIRIVDATPYEPGRADSHLYLASFDIVQALLKNDQRTEASKRLKYAIMMQDRCYDSFPIIFETLKTLVERGDSAEAKKMAHFFLSEKETQSAAVKNDFLMNLAYSNPLCK